QQLLDGGALGPAGDALSLRGSGDRSDVFLSSYAGEPNGDRLASVIVKASQQAGLPPIVASSSAPNNTGDIDVREQQGDGLGRGIGGANSNEAGRHIECWALREKAVGFVNLSFDFKWGATNYRALREKALDFLNLSFDAKRVAMRYRALREKAVGFLNLSF